MYRIGYPRPQFVREDWMSLNGEWQFEFDTENKGYYDCWQKEHKFSKTIEVPFVYQSKMSGIDTNIMCDYVWYNRYFQVPQEWYGKTILMHFGAVDYEAQVFINGHMAGSHRGGHVGFSVDITPYLTGGEEKVTVRVFDPAQEREIPRGKQYWFQNPRCIWYKRTTGIWQSVWLEPIAPYSLSNVRFTPDIDRGTVLTEYEFSHLAPNMKIHTSIHYKGFELVQDTSAVHGRKFSREYDLFSLMTMKPEECEGDFYWTPEAPNLYDVTMTVIQDGEITDKVTSYFGMRKVECKNGEFYLNNVPYYQKLILDQGYWPDSLMTAPSDDALKEDILAAKAMGFNGCRKHQKTEDPIFLYYADTLGYLVWGECASNMAYSPQAAEFLIGEWFEILKRDYNHPSIVAWVPLNESWGVSQIATLKEQQHHALSLYHAIKSIDCTRAVVCNDGWEMCKSDICAVHNYKSGLVGENEKNQKFAEMLENEDAVLSSRPAGRDLYVGGFSHTDEPILLTEFGGIAFAAKKESGWGYTVCNNAEELVASYRCILETIRKSKIIRGFCYTQLTDVEQEINGLLTYDRKPKCDFSEIKKINDAV